MLIHKCVLCMCWHLTIAVYLTFAEGMPVYLAAFIYLHLNISRNILAQSFYHLFHCILPSIYFSGLFVLHGFTKSCSYGSSSPIPCYFILCICLLLDINMCSSESLHGAETDYCGLALLLGILLRSSYHI